MQDFEIFFLNNGSAVFQTPNIMARENFQPGMKVVVWGKYDTIEAPQILSVRKNGIWITRSERDLLGRIKITKERVPLHAVSPL